MLGLRMQQLILPILAAGVVAAVVHFRRSRDTKAPRGRLRELVFCAALLLISVVVLSTVGQFLLVRNLISWGLLIPLAAAIIVVVRPDWATQVVPPVLILYGLAGFVVVRDYSSGLVDTYGLSVVGGAGAQAEVILPQAYLCLLLGCWLLWRTKAVPSDRRRRLLGRAASLPGRGQAFALVLLPTMVAAAAIVAPQLWLGILFTGVVLIGAATVVRRWPDQAAKAATAGLACLGLLGLALAIWSYDGGFGFARLSSGDILYGPVLVTRTMPWTIAAAAVEAIGLLAVAAWMAPQTSPEFRRLLEMAPDAELLGRVQWLTESRADAVDTASADLRRLERDLHDGAQARLVALGMSLRAAERLIPTSPDAAIALVAEAREASARALTELRELVRGVLPPVLADRGLADAVRALALDSPLAVQTAIDVPGRPPAPVETACYFAVAEVLTNAAKHSGARDARVSLSHTDGMLRIEVTDFGLGGADPARGSGLAGVEKRLATFDGILVVSSPVGGPTIVVMEVPCALSSPRISSS
jgi:signal transduction histidine kinase